MAKAKIPGLLLQGKGSDGGRCVPSLTLNGCWGLGTHWVHWWGEGWKVLDKFSQMDEPRKKQAHQIHLPEPPANSLGSLLTPSSPVTKVTPEKDWELPGFSPGTPIALCSKVTWSPPAQ